MGRFDLSGNSAADRNKQPILDQLARLFADVATVLEVGAGSGVHARHFAPALPHLTWQPTECQAMLPALHEGCAGAPDNLLAPSALDAAAGAWNLGRFHAVFTANTLHILAWPSVENMFRRVAETLCADGRFCVYGPFNEGGRYISEGNRELDALLKSRAPERGIRDKEAVRNLAARCELTGLEDIAMPANNRMLVFCRPA